MNREELIKKWLDHNLNPEEQKAFELLDDYDELVKVTNALEAYKASDFSVDANYQNLKSRLKSKDTKVVSWIKPLLRIAAMLALGFSIYYYTTTLDTEINTLVAQQTQVELPDASTVNLNSNSTLIFNKNNWNNNREVTLDGEAFFKVAKGQKFDVVTSDGIVSVLGTQFNVKQRLNYFEVTCYEGLVAVTHKEKIVKLYPGYTFKFINGKQIANEKESTIAPSWLNGESNFKSVPLSHVISEFENQYNLKVTIDNIDSTRLYSGSFTHKNLDLALKSITLPLNLSYSKSGNIITLKRE